MQRNREQDLRLPAADLLCRIKCHFESDPVCIITHVPEFQVVKDLLCEVVVDQKGSTLIEGVLFFYALIA